ncbi:hypothetical protein [Psychrobacter sanguinis]|uniref:hypothetical protein n=1 Tax=Psychrobacter sanguinis TaxID=861445 RepID=UPI002A75B73A|nr:hypothetical protein [Psychrobacter sanguinis]MDY3307125.1 hypothetical protein [Psychrobacter sanguinis]
MGNLTHEEYLNKIAEDSKDIYKTFKAIISKHDLDYIMMHIFKHVMFNTYNRVNTPKENQDYKLLELMNSEVKEFISSSEIDFSHFHTARKDYERIFMEFNNSKLRNRDLANELNQHDLKHIMRSVLNLMLWHNLALIAYEKEYYLLALNQLRYSDLKASQLNEVIWHETPYEKHTREIKEQSLDLAEEIWLYDEDKILLRKHVAEIITNLLLQHDLSITQVDNWLKQSSIVPPEILERYKNNDYGNSKPIVKNRGKLIAEIMLKLTPLYCESL